MQKKDAKMLASLALASAGIGSLLYSYMKMHPIKAKVIAHDMKNIMKDFK